MTIIKETLAPGSAIEADGGSNKIWIDLITPGWGSSGYYAKEMLQRDMPKIYPSGSHMYIDHPTMSEMHERPERSVKDLAAVLTEQAHWDESRGSIGAHAELFPDHREPILSKAKAIGVSIFADGEVEESGTEIDGKTGPIIHSLTDGFSADFVTVAGRGGQIGEGANRAGLLRPLLESARKELEEKDQSAEHVQGLREALAATGASESEIDGIVAPIQDFLAMRESEASRPTDGGKEGQMDELEKVRQQLSEAESAKTTAEGERDTAIQERDEARTERDRAQDAIQLAEAGRVIKSTLDGDEFKGLPERAKERAVGSALREKLPLSEDGKLVKETLQERAKVAAKEEIEYLTESGAGGSGTGVTGLGSGVSLSGGAESGNGGGGSGDTDAGRKALKESLVGLGMTEEMATIAAEGR